MYGQWKHCTKAGKRLISLQFVFLWPLLVIFAHTVIIIKFSYVLKPSAIEFWLWGVSEGSSSISLYSLLSTWNFWIRPLPSNYPFFTALLHCFVLFPRETLIGLLSSQVILHCPHKALFWVLLLDRADPFISLFCFDFKSGLLTILLSSTFHNKLFKSLLLKLHWT